MDHQRTALDVSLVQVLERTELVAPAVEGWRRHGEVLQKSSSTSNALFER
jgi:hypothetical protein